MIKKILLAAMLAASIGSIAIPVSAQGLRNPPPPPRHEVVPASRPGYSWVAGHWDRVDGRYQWNRGHWVRDRAGRAYTPPTWVERDGRWYRERGSWRNAPVEDANPNPGRQVRDRD